MANISQYGYQKIREYAKTNWKYIELQDADGIVVKRFIDEKVKVGVDSFSRPIYEDRPGATITSSVDSPEITYTVVAEGETFTGKTVAKVALFDVATDGTAISIEEFPVFTFTDIADQLTVNLKLQVPQVI